MAPLARGRPAAATRQPAMVAGGGRSTLCEREDPSNGSDLSRFEPTVNNDFTDNLCGTDGHPISLGIIGYPTVKGTDGDSTFSGTEDYTDFSGADGYFFLGTGGDATVNATDGYFLPNTDGDIAFNGTDGYALRGADGGALPLLVRRGRGRGLGHPAAPPP